MADGLMCSVLGIGCDPKKEAERLQKECSEKPDRLLLKSLIPDLPGKMLPKMQFAMDCVRQSVDLERAKMYSERVTPEQLAQYEKLRAVVVNIEPNNREAVFKCVQELGDSSRPNNTETETRHFRACAAKMASK